MTIENLTQKVNSGGLPPGLKETAQELIERISALSKSADYFAQIDSLGSYLDWVTQLPWNTETEEKLDLNKTKEVLDSNHFGMQSVKERILEYLSVRKLLVQKNSQAASRSPVLCFVGLQGIGKTTLAISIAQAMGRNFQRVSMAAIGTTAQIRGTSRTLTDAEPGQIIKALVRSKVKNPLILLDEIDKVSADVGLRNDVMSALLEVLDPAQNSTFMDHFIDYPVDLSPVLFICTANNLGPISTPLMDRLEIIEMPSYTDQEKVLIGKNYLMPKILEETGLDKTQVVIDDNIWTTIVRPLGFDAGVRTLDRNLRNLCGKVAKRIVTGQGTSFHLTEANIHEFLPTY